MSCRFVLNLPRGDVIEFEVMLLHQVATHGRDVKFANHGKANRCCFEQSIVMLKSFKEVGDTFYGKYIVRIINIGMPSQKKHYIFICNVVDI